MATSPYDISPSGKQWGSPHIALVWVLNLVNEERAYTGSGAISECDAVQGMVALYQEDMHTTVSDTASIWLRMYANFLLGSKFEHVWPYEVHWYHQAFLELHRILVAALSFLTTPEDLSEVYGQTQD